MRKAPELEDVDDYIALQTKPVQKLLRQLRATIRAAAPAATEEIAYRMPAYKLHGRPLVYFAAFEKHIGLYATPVTNAAFKKALEGYKTSKGTVQLPLDKPLPLTLVTKMVKYKAKDLTTRYGVRKLR